MNNPYSQEKQQALLRLARSRNAPRKSVLRAKIVLKRVEGLWKREIAEQLGTSRPTVDLWIKRYEKGGIEALCNDASRPGRTPQIPSEKEKAIVEATLHGKPANAKNWSVRSMAKAQGTSRMTVHRIWRKHNLKPHRIRTFKLSQDPHFVEKVKDIVGLYLNPPDEAWVLSVDEKSQIQAWDRTQRGLPMKKGRAGTMHDYKRQGTTTLFSALDVLNGKVIGQCVAKHRPEEFLRFLQKIHQETPKRLDLHLMVDNYGSHKTVRVKDWLAQHPRFHLHFPPTSASWLKRVEGFFSALTQKRIRRGAFKSVKELETTIIDFIDHRNEDPQMFRWTKDADTILSKVNKCKEALGTVYWVVSKVIALCFSTLYGPPEGTGLRVPLHC